MRRVVLIAVLILALFTIPAPARQGGCGQCADGAHLAGNIAFNLCRDNGESDEVASCCSSLAKLNYAYANCPGCTDLIQFLIEHNTCMD